MLRRGQVMRLPHMTDSTQASTLALDLTLKDSKLEAALAEARA